MFWEKFFLCGFSLYTFLFFGLFHCIIHIQTSIILTVVLFLFLSIFVVENYELEIIKSKNNRKEIHNMCVILFVSNNQSFVGKNQKEKQIIYYISHPHIHWLNEKQYRFDDEKIETHLIHFISFQSFLYYKTYHLIIGLQISAIDCDFLPKNVALYIFVVLVVFLWFLTPLRNGWW